MTSPTKVTVEELRRLVRTTVDALFEPGDVVELRVLNVPRRGVVYGYFDDFDQLVEAAMDFDGNGAVYLTLNPVNPALLGRANNRGKDFRKGDASTTDRDIVRRRYLLIDSDPIRPSGIASTDSEHALARTVADRIRAYLAEKGWGEPIDCDSGNGAHLLYAIDLANDEDATALLEKCLAALQQMFGTSEVKVDEKVFNAARITRCYGTMNRKGDATKDRPHRRSHVISTPVTRPIVTLEQLTALADQYEDDEVAKARAKSKTKRSRGASAPKRDAGGTAPSGRRDGLDLDKWLAEHDIEIAKTKPGNDGATIYVLARCPWNADHTNESAYIVRQESGALAAGCHHDGCKGKDWHALRDVVEPGWRDARKDNVDSRDGADPEDPTEEPARSKLPEILIRLDEERTNDEAIRALATHPDAYRRGDALVQIAAEPEKPSKTIRREPGSPRIVILRSATIREMLASRARWMQWDGDKLVPTRPPGWSVAAVSQRASWPEVRPLEAVVETPVIRCDGTVLETPGYDAATGIYFKAPPNRFPQIPVAPTKDHAIRARNLLLDVVADFPFETPAHKSAWLSGVLTPFARHAYEGPTPLTIIDGNIRGVGKSLLCDTFGLIATGRRMARMPHVEDDDEMRKRITALAIAGDPMILIDNVAGVLGGPSLDAALTSVEWKDRVLGESRTITVPFFAIWYATGNNVTLGADTVRRCLHVRLESVEEKPEERSTFVHDNLVDWIAKQRAQLVSAALTILRAYFVDGAPDMKVARWGSFEGWSNLVRNCIVWLGLTDPGGARKGLAENADRDATLIRQVMDGLYALTGEVSKTEFTASQLIGYAGQKSGDSFKYEALAEAIATMVDRSGKVTPNSVGTRLGQVRNRVVDGQRLECRTNTKQGTLWSVKCAPSPPPKAPPSQQSADQEFAENDAGSTSDQTSTERSLGQTDTTCLGMEEIDIEYELRYAVREGWVTR